MISEDYVSFETAKLLKEKGFDSECHSYYYPCHYPDGSIQYHKYMRTEIVKNKSWYDIYSLKNLPKDHYLAPTLQMAMKWLRKEHNLFVFPFPQMNANKFWVEIYQLSDNKEWENLYCESIDLKDYPLYEEACEAGIQYCLQNLI